MIIDRRQSGRSGISQPGNLHGRRLAGEEQKPIIGRMQFEVDQDVDLVAPHQVGSLLIGEPGNAAPDVGIAAQTIGHGIRLRSMGITEDLELAVVMTRQERDSEKGVDMFAKMRRDVTDPQPPFGIRNIGVRSNVSPEWFGVPRVPLTAFRSNR